MVAMSLHEFIYLLPILILGCAIVILLFLLLVVRANTRISAIFSIASLALAFISSVVIGYQVMSKSDLLIAVPYSEGITQQVPSAAVVQQLNTVTSNTSPLVNNTDNNLNDANSNNHSSNNQATITDTQISDSNNNIVLNANTLSHGDDSITVYSIDDNDFWVPTYVTALFTSDGYAMLYSSLILFVAITVALLAFNWFSGERPNNGLFYIILLFATLGGIILVHSSHLISLFIGIELLSLPLVGLVGFQYTQKNTLEAALKYMVLSAVATAFLLLGIAFYYAATGELTFVGLSFQLSTLAYPSSLLLLGVCLLLVGICFKLSLVPFQLWLPDVYQGAPACVSLFLITVGKVAVFCAVARLFLIAPIVNNDTIRIIMVIIAFGSIIWGNIFAVNQHNIKRLLAYSSICQFGYLLIALIAVQYQVLALETIGIYLIGYIFANICILGVISLESKSSATQDQENEFELCGLFWRRPLLGLVMAIGLLSFAGIPLTIGFIGRFTLILLGVTAQLWWLVGALVIGSAFGLYYYSRLAINLFIKPSDASIIIATKTTFKQSLRQISVIESILVMVALLILLCGIYPNWLFTLVSLAQYLPPQ